MAGLKNELKNLVNYNRSNMFYLLDWQKLRKQTLFYVDEGMRKQVLSITVRENVNSHNILGSLHICTF